MIDYEKLKIANELCEKTDGYHFFCDYSNRYGVSEITLCHKGRYIEDCSDIDDLINKLKELTQPKPKYEVGQEVFWLVSDIIYSGMVVCCKPNANRWKIKIDDELIEIDDCHLYPSREALIDAQIEYWQSLKEPVKPEDMHPKFEGEVKGFRCFDDELEVRQCEHESESISSRGIIKSCEGDINKPFKCKKCGEFYR